MKKRRLHDFSELTSFYAEWWTMLKAHFEYLRSEGWTDEAWAKVIKETGAWHVNSKMPFAPKMGAIEQEILVWLRDNVG